MFKGNKVTSNFPLCLTGNALRWSPVSFTLRLHYPWFPLSGMLAGSQMDLKATKDGNLYISR